MKIENLSQLGSGPPLSFEIRDRKGKLVRTVVVPEDRLVSFLQALDQAGGPGLGPVNLYGDTTLSHDRCQRALDSCRRALEKLQGDEAIRCGEAIVNAVAEVARDPKINLFVIGN